MRNFRKTRKRGGVSVSTILECIDPYKTMVKCEAEFLRLNNFMRIKIPGDGNCFYHALSKYYSLSNPPGSRPPTHSQLRKRIIDVMENNINEASVGLVINMSNIPNSIKANNKEAIKMAKYLEVLDNLREDGVWNSDNADIVSQFTARALNIKLNIFDKKSPQAAKKIFMSKTASGTKIYKDLPAEPAKIICYTFEPIGYVGSETINLLRVNNSHYELLYPKDAPVAPKGKKIVRTNTVKNLTTKVGKMTLANRLNIKPIRIPVRPHSPTPLVESNIPTGRYILRSRTTKKPVQYIQPVRKIQRKTRENIEAEELQATIAASLQNSHKPLSNNFYNMLASFEEK
jgi:hypothetical protein